MGIADFGLGFLFLIVLLAAGWTGTLRDIAYRWSSQNYSLAVFYYLLMLMLISKALGTPLEYYEFRLEHRYHLSNQRFRSWLWDELKGSLISLLLAAIVVELLYSLIRQVPQQWWLTVFPGLTIVAIVLCVNFMGDGLRDALDPTQRRIRA